MGPIAQEPADRLDHLGEVGLLARVPGWLGAAAPPPPAGPGDDAALLPPGGRAFNVVTVDSIVRGRHFDDQLAPERVGAKLVNRNLSDLAAMGAEPGGAVLALMVPAAASVAWLERFFQGVGAAAHAAGLQVQGGDVAASQHDWIGSLTVWGHASRPALRSGAQPGDSLWVTGDLGGSLAEHHWAFSPRLAEGAWLADRTELRAMMDVTDGLGKDLPALLGPGLTARLDLAALPVRATVRAAAATSGMPELWHVLNDGEDYELLFALAADTDNAAFQRAWLARFPSVRLTRLGDLIARPPDRAAVQDAATGHDLAGLRGYAHFTP